MDPAAIHEAASLIWHSWRNVTCIATLPASCCPATRAEGYAIQAEIARLSGEPVRGWKIAATSIAGQKHIHVDGPLGGRLLASKVLGDGAAISLKGNIMLVGEAEFAFRMGNALPSRLKPYAIDEVIAAVKSMHPAIEIPDTRFTDCTKVGAAQMIADNACAAWFVLGAATTAPWRDRDLVNHRVTVGRNETPYCEGRGANVLGDPRLALTWIANELRELGDGLQAEDVVTTGTCVVPFAITPGDRIRADFGEFGSVSASMTA
jgi:2-keto-4-pentenoate hydratase